MLLAAVISGAPLGEASAQTLAQQWAWCRDHDPERLIGGCSAVIRHGRETPDNLSRAFFNRGRAWSEMGQYDRAIKDFGQAIRLDPRYADAFNGRALAYAGKGDQERAIQDFDQAIRIDPNYAIAIYNRALALQSLGRTEQAAEDFARARQAGPRLTPAKE